MVSPEVAAQIKAFDVHPSRVLGVCLMLLVLSILFVSLRFYVRARILKTFMSDDWVLLVALVCLNPRDGDLR